MKKKAPFIIAVFFTVCSLVNMIGSHSAAATPTQTTVTEVAVTNTAPAADKKAENKPLYIITAMYNNELVALDCWDTNHRNKALTSPTILKWPGNQCRDIELHIVVKVKQVNLVDSNFNFVAKLKVTTLKNGAQVVKFVMDPELAGTEHTIEKDGDPNYVLYRDYYFQIISTDSNITPQYTSVRYGIN